MLNILINAYACSPNWGSEPGMAWNWVSNLAKYCELYIITEGEWRDEIEEAVEAHPYGKNMHFFFNPVPDKVRKMCWNQGDWRFYYYYRKWQKKTLRIAEQICKEHQIDITHQLNMIGFREPGLLWKIDGPKHVWGPMGSMGSVPISFLGDSSFMVKGKNRLKNIITNYQICHGNVRKAMLASDVVITALTATKQIIQSKYDKEVIVINETGLEVKPKVEHTIYNGTPIRLLWVGRFIPTKKLSIALSVLASLAHKGHFELHIVGEGTAEENNFYRCQAKELGVEDRCIWYGKIPNHDVLELMKSSHLFFFTSVFEGTPHVVLEAISNNLPILCFDTCGQGEVVNETIGIKIPLVSTELGVKEFVEKLDWLDQHRDVLLQMSLACENRKKELSWESKAKQMVDIYQNIIKG